jgi:hypothetical protein
VVREGANLYQAGPRTELERSVIEEGRKRELDFLRRFSQPRCTNTASFDQSIVQRGVLMDQFRVQCGSLDGFREHDTRALQRRYDSVWQTDSSDTRLVAVRQQRYDNRVRFFDLTAGQCRLVLFLLFIGLGFALLAAGMCSDMTILSRRQAALNEWLAETYADQQPIESAFD